MISETKFFGFIKHATAVCVCVCVCVGVWVCVVIVCSVLLLNILFCLEISDGCQAVGETNMTPSVQSTSAV